nr:hypothetical protein [Tanacetum cinerariifolium]
VSHDQLTQQVSTLQTQVTGEERIKVAFEEFKKYEDDRVEKRCTKMDTRLRWAYGSTQRNTLAALCDLQHLGRRSGCPGGKYGHPSGALSIDFDKELYPHMLTAIVGRRWAIGRSLRLVVIKCAESIKLRQAFTNVMSVEIDKGMSEGLAHDIENGKAGRAREFKGAPIEVIMTSLYLESDSGMTLLSGSVTIALALVYPEVRDPRDPWGVKEELLLEEAIAANVSHAEKKKKRRVVCRTHGFGSAHHARSGGVPVSMPTISPQGLAILLADAAIQTETFEDNASPRLLRSKSFPPMYKLDWLQYCMWYLDNCFVCNFSTDVHDEQCIMYYPLRKNCTFSVLYAHWESFLMHLTS